MIPYDFEYERPHSLEEAAALLRRSGPGARLMGGGTDLLPNMRVRILQPSLLVSLGAISPAPPMSGEDGFVRIDALTRLADLENSDLIRSEIPMLAESAHAVGGNQIRQMGTLGGNLGQETRCLYLNQAHDYQFTAPCYKRGGHCCYPYPGNKSDTCWSVYMSDVAPALIALGAGIEIVGEGGMRRIPAQALFSGNALKPLTLAPGEIIGSVVIPRSPQSFGWGYHKSSIRGGLEFAMVNMAVALHLEPDGRTCTAARIAVGAISEGPLQPASATGALIGRELNAQTLERAADEAGREINPLPHHGFTRSYLKENIRVNLRRTLAAALERAVASTADRQESTDEHN